MKVLKFGGTSVGSAERIRQLLPLVSDGERKIVVLSAMAGTTSKLEEIGKLLAQGQKPVAAALCEELREHYIAVTEDLFGKQGVRRIIEEGTEPGKQAEPDYQSKSDAAEKAFAAVDASRTSINTHSTTFELGIEPAFSDPV